MMSEVIMQEMARFITRLIHIKIRPILMKETLRKKDEEKENTSISRRGQCWLPQFPDG